MAAKYKWAYGMFGGVVLGVIETDIDTLLYRLQSKGLDITKKDLTTPDEYNRIDITWEETDWQGYTTRYFLQRVPVYHDL